MLNPSFSTKSIIRVVLLTLCVLNVKLHAQNQSPITKSPTFSFNNGLGFVSPDSSFGLSIRLRIQNRIGATLTEMSDGTWQVSQNEFRVRRARVRFDGFVFNPKWTYAIQLSFSRADMDWDGSSVPNVLRDAMIFYRPSKNWIIGFGQGKLPGNRQRVISSGEQQFVDRSIVNATFTIDRDFGINTSYTIPIGKPQIIVRAALTSGEGRNEGVVAYNKVNAGLCYTGRIEFLPFGAFDKRGDYSEADLARETKPKLSLAGGWSYNEQTVRTGGQLGRSLLSPLNMNTLITDVLFKYRGLSIYGEYVNRMSTTSPLTYSYDGNGKIIDTRWIYQGEGILGQAGYLFKNNYEIAARFAQITPQKEINNLEEIRKNYAICFSKYLKGHRLKLQSDFTLEELYDGQSKARNGRNIAWRFQIEMGL